MTNAEKELRIIKVFGEYDGKKEMLRLATEEMFNMLPLNENGEVNAEALEQMNEWARRMEERIIKKLGNDIKSLDNL